MMGGKQMAGQHIRPNCCIETTLIQQYLDAANIEIAVGHTNAFSLPEVAEQFVVSMKKAGLEPVDAIACQRGTGLVRFRCEADPPGCFPGWAILVFDGNPKGGFGHFPRGIHGAWRAPVEGNLSGL